MIPPTHTTMREILTPTTARLPLSTMLRLRGVHLDLEDETGGTESSESSSGDDPNSFVNRMAKKYEDEDRKAMDAADGVEDDDDADDEAPPARKGKAKGKTVDSDDDDDDAEHPDSGTSDEDDDPSDESDDDSADDDDEEHPDDAEDDEAEEDSSDDDDATDDDEEDGEEGVSAAAKAALAAKGADLKIDDVPEKYRPIIERKLKGIDAAFTKVQTEATAFRSERTQFAAEKKFQAENPEMVVVELLFKDGKLNEELFEKVNAQLAKLDDPTVAEAFKVVVEKKRTDAVKAIEDQTAGAERFNARVDEVETLTKKQAAVSGLPAWIADQAVGNAVSAALREKRDVTNDEVIAAVNAAAKQYRLEHREKDRAKSKEKIKARTEQRRVAPPANKKPGSAAPAGAANPKRRDKINWDSQESREKRILESTRRILPGAR